jgi:hypothetical protein
MHLSGVVLSPDTESHTFTLNIDQYANSLRRDDHNGVGHFPTRCVLKEGPRVRKSGKWPDPNLNSYVSLEGILTRVEKSSDSEDALPTQFHVDVDFLVFHGRPNLPPSDSRTFIAPLLTLVCLFNLD